MTVTRQSGVDPSATSGATGSPSAGERLHGPTLAYIAPLDGVRALAVLAVMAYHGGIGRMSGGFLGVDTFFVLSGFLITTLLVNEWSAEGGIRLPAFWARRARRLLPALLLMLLFVAAYAHFLVAPGTYPDLRSDAIATLAYVANWHFIASGSNYFAATGPVSPLTHTWSLAVEEQFYLVWPPIVLGVLLVFRKKRPEVGLSALLVISLLGAVASAAAMALLYTGTNQTRLYYGTDTHAQCILTGASLGLVLALLAKRPRRPARAHARRGAPEGSSGDPRWAARSTASRTVLTVAGVVGLIATGYLWTHVTGTQSWLYHGGFLVAAAATASVLVSAVCHQRGPVGRLLAVPPLRYLGKISYGLYLWHFPLFLTLNASRTGLLGWRLFMVRVAVTIGVATMSFYLVEQPIRRGSLLRGRHSLVVAPAAIGAVVVALVLATIPIAGSSALASPVAHSTGVPKAPVPNRPGSYKVMLVGDSMANTLGNGIEGRVASYFGLTIVNDGTPDCSITEGTFQVQDFPPQAPAPPCRSGSGDPGWPVDWQNLIRVFNPSVSIFLARLDIVDHLMNGSWTHIGDPAFDSYLLGQLHLAVQVLTSRGGKVILMTTPYYSTGEQPDGQPWPEDNPERVDLYNAMIRQTAAQFPGQAFVFDLNRLADPNGRFQAYIDGVEIRFTDGIHWTYQGDCWLAPRILPYVRAVAEWGAPPSMTRAATLVAHAERSFPTALCHAPN